MSTLETVAAPEKGTSRLLTLLRVHMAVGESYTFATRESEHVLDVLGGACSVNSTENGGQERIFEHVGGRSDIFSGKPEFVYIPRRATYTVRCLAAPFEAAIYVAPTEQDSTAQYVAGDAVKASRAGVSDWQRDVYIGLGEQSPATMMMVGETDSPPGNWSGFPPHRHAEEAPPLERRYEELYYFKFQPVTGFAVGGVYQDAKDRPGTAKLVLVEDSEAFDAPGGFHFISPCPGYRLRYTWALGGPGKKFGAWTVDPDHAWLLNYKEDH
jgi:5-deoxy-glucuronate isomerase